MKMKTTTHKWRAFTIAEVFPSIQRGKRLKTEDHARGATPYVSSSSIRNGIDDFVGNRSGVRVFGNCLTIANSGSVGTVFFHPYRFVASDHVTKLSLDGVNRYVYLFLAACAGKIATNYSFNREINDERLRREKIMLPVTPVGDPDYAFMEETMREKERAMLERYADCARRILAEPRHELSLWKAFPLSDIFEISPGVRLTKADMKSGQTPFAGASDSNNGITAFVSNRNESLDRDVLGVNYNGSVGESFYHPYDTVFSDDVKRFRVKGHPGGRHVYLFLKVAILKQAAKYQYGYKFNEEHMRRQSLLLPSIPDGAPDFAGMEAFMRHKEAEQIARYAGIRLQDHITKCAVS